MNKVIQFSILLIFLVLIITGSYPKNIDSYFIGAILLLNGISIVSFLFLYKERFSFLKGQYLKISYLFLFSLSIVHFQMYVDLILGNIDSQTLFLWINPKIAILSLLVSSSALSSYLLGYTLKHKFKIKNIRANLKPLKFNFLKAIAILFLLGFYATVNKQYLVGDYGNTPMGNAALYFSFLFESTICAILILYARNIIISNRNVSVIDYFNELKMVYFLLGIYLMGVMMSGDRGPIIFNLLFSLVVFLFVFKIKIKLSKIIIAILIASSFVSLLGILRSNEGTFFESIQSKNNLINENRYYPNSFSENTKELATSARCLNIATDYVENGGKHTFGIFFMQDVMLLIPSLKGTVINALDVPKHLTSSPQFLTFLDLGAFATWGVGSTCIADTYLDFGVIGVVFIFMLFGYISRYFECLIFSNNLPNFILLAIAFSVFAYSIYIPRSTILYSLNKVFYIAALVYMVIIINKRKFN